MPFPARPLLVLAVLALACAPAAEAPAGDPPGTVTVIARGLTFEAPDTIPPGWTTFRFVNESPMIHFALLGRLPEGIGIAEQQREVAPVFQDGLNLLLAGRPDDAMARFGQLPAWFGQIVFLGGPGFTGAGRTSTATVYLEPGTYLLECYVKTAGVFHSVSADPAVYGMVHQLTVTGAPTDATEPTATLAVTLSSARGLEVSGEPTAGEHTVAVRFEDQTTHENFVGHDVHLVRLAEDADPAVVGAWMDWSRPGGLETPAPAEFVGGLNEMAAGATGYFGVTLAPGRYAWVSEVTEPGRKGMLRTFTVPPAGR